MKGPARLLYLPIHPALFVAGLSLSIFSATQEHLQISELISVIVASILLIAITIFILWIPIGGILTAAITFTTIASFLFYLPMILEAAKIDKNYWKYIAFFGTFFVLYFVILIRKKYIPDQMLSFIFNIATLTMLAPSVFLIFLTQYEIRKIRPDPRDTFSDITLSTNFRPDV